MTRQRRFLAVGLLVALLVAGVGSYYASSHPDGLEYVAGTTGFLDSADEPVDTGSPFADYGTEGVDDARLSGGIAGVAGVLAAGLSARPSAGACPSRRPCRISSPRVGGV